MQSSLKLTYRGYAVVLNSETPEEFRFPNETAIEIFKSYGDCEVSKGSFTWSDVERTKSEAGSLTTKQAIKACFTRAIDQLIEDNVRPERTAYRKYDVTTYRATKEKNRKPGGTAIRIHVPDDHKARWTTWITWANVEHFRIEHGIKSTDEAITRYFKNWIDNNRALNRPRPHTMVEFLAMVAYPGLAAAHVIDSSNCSIAVVIVGTWLAALLCNSSAHWRNTVTGALRGATFFALMFASCPDSDASNKEFSSYCIRMMLLYGCLTVVAEVVRHNVTHGKKFPHY